MLYLDIQASEDLCITSYCDNHSLLKNEEKFHTRDINSSSWYMNPDHDVIMTLSALRTKVTFRWHRYTFALIKTDTATSTYSRDLHNSTFLPTHSLPKHSRNSAQRDNLHKSTHYPHAAPTCVMALDTSQAAKRRTLRNEFSEYEIRAYLQQRNGWTAHILDSINWIAYRAAISAITNQVRTFVIKFSHDWLPVGVRDYRNGAATDTYPQCIQLETTRHLYLCHSRTLWRDQFIDKLTKHLKDATSAADLRCTIVEGIQQCIQQWFTTADTNESDQLDASTQLSWLQIIKGYIPNQWSMTQAKFSRDQGLDSRYNSGERWTSQHITFFWTQGHTLWKDRCTSAPAPAADSLVKSSARNRQTAQNVTTMAYASSPLMLAIDGASSISHWRNASEQEHLISKLRTRQCSQTSASALARRRIKS
jgi:hypothetical protein